VNVPDDQAKPRPCRGMLSLQDGMKLHREVAEQNCTSPPTPAGIVKRTTISLKDNAFDDLNVVDSMIPDA
jgi:hypothetical protein